MAKSRISKGAILALGNAVSTIIGLVIAMVLSRVFQKHEYATYRQTLLTFQLVAPFLSLGLPSALLYFMPGEGARAKGILVEVLLVLAAMGSLFSLFLVFGGNTFVARVFGNPDLEKTLLVFAPYAIFFLPVSAIGCCLVVREKLSWFLAFSIVGGLTNLGLVLATAIRYPDRPEATVLATTVVSALMCCLAVPLMLRSVSGTRGGCGLTSIVSQLRYAVPLGLASMLELAALATDKALVSALCTPEQFAVFVNGAIEIPFIGLLTGSAMAIILPDMVSSCRGGKKGEALALWKRTARKVSIILLPLAGFLFVLAPNLVTLLFSEAYLESARPFRIYLLLIPARVVFFGAIFQALGRPDIILKRAIGTLILNALVSWVLIREYGFEGAAWGTVLVFWGYVIPHCFFFACRLLEVKWWDLLPWKFLGSMLLGLVAAVSLALMVQKTIVPSQTFAGVIVVACSYLALAAPIVVFLGISEFKVEGLKVLERARSLWSSK